MAMMMMMMLMIMMTMMMMMTMTVSIMAMVMAMQGLGPSTACRWGVLSVAFVLLQGPSPLSTISAWHLAPALPRRPCQHKQCYQREHKARDPGS
eukprot:1994752-Karenia_brevis.AAC.1